MKPSTYMLVSEPARGLIESLSLAAAYPILRRISPVGEGVIITVPGFTGSDASMYMLRKFLTDIGYECHGWGQGMNTSITPTSIARFAIHINRFYEEIGQPIHLIGHSLGGVYAREVAKIMPDAVKSVITLGSPFNEPEEAVHEHVIKLYRKFNKPAATDRAIIDAMKVPPVCRTHSIYSEHDGVVHWGACLQEDGHDKCYNHHIKASHFGMAHHPKVLHLISKILAKDE